MKPCKNGHVAIRYVRATGAGDCPFCVAERIKRQRASGRRREIDRRYYQKHRAKYRIAT
jgi:hypothetical protein